MRIPVLLLLAFLSFSFFSSSCFAQNRFVLEDGVLFEARGVPRPSNSSFLMAFEFASNAPVRNNTSIAFRLFSANYSGYPLSYIVTFAPQNVTSPSAINQSEIVLQQHLTRTSIFPYFSQFYVIHGRTYYINFFATPVANDTTVDITIQGWNGYGICLGGCDRGICINSTCKFCAQGYGGANCDGYCPSNCSGIGKCIGNNICECPYANMTGNCDCAKTGNYKNGLAIQSPNGFWTVDKDDFYAGAIMTVFGYEANKVQISADNKACPLMTNPRFSGMGELAISPCDLLNEGAFVTILNNTDVAVRIVPRDDLMLQFRQNLSVVPRLEPSFYVLNLEQDVLSGAVVNLTVTSSNSSAACKYILAMKRGSCPIATFDYRIVTNGSGCANGVISIDVGPMPAGNYYFMIISYMPDTVANLLVHAPLDNETCTSCSSWTTTGSTPIATTTTTGTKKSNSSFLVPFMSLVYLCLCFIL